MPISTIAQACQHSADDVHDIFTPRRAEERGKGRGKAGVMVNPSALLSEPPLSLPRGGGLLPVSDIPFCSHRTVPTCVMFGFGETQTLGRARLVSGALAATPSILCSLDVGWQL